MRHVRRCIGWYETTRRWICWCRSACPRRPRRIRVRPVVGAIVVTTHSHSQINRKSNRKSKSNRTTRKVHYRIDAFTKLLDEYRNLHTSRFGAFYRKVFGATRDMKIVDLFDAPPAR